MDIGRQMTELTVPEGRLAVCWAGQAGFIFKDSKGHIAAVDLYISDCGERMKGFKRFSAKLVDPAGFAPDYYLITHSHFDHLDYDAVPEIAKNGKTLFLTTPSCGGILKEMGIPEQMIRVMELRETAGLEDVQVTSLEADHGGMVPDSYGFLLKMGGKTVYITGDTCYREDIFREAAEAKPDVIVACINGRFGNLDSRDAAMAASYVGAQTAIPCHFWTFLQHGGSPEEFAACMEQYAPEVKPLFFTQGEIRIL